MKILFVLFLMPLMLTACSGLYVEAPSHASAHETTHGTHHNFVPASSVHKAPASAVHKNHEMDVCVGQACQCEMY